MVVVVVVVVVVVAAATAAVVVVGLPCESVFADVDERCAPCVTA